MLVIGLIREGKVPVDNRVALSPAQCKWLHKNFSDIKVVAQPSTIRCFRDAEYRQAGVEVTDDLSACTILFGIKEVPVDQLIEGKVYMFFSHTRKRQPHNAKMLGAMMNLKNTLIDYECLVHDDGQRIIGFGFFAGIVGAHNGMMAFGKRKGLYNLERVYKHHDYRKLIDTYFGLKLPPIKIAVTGSGRVAHGIVEIMNLMDVIEVEVEDFKNVQYKYPVFAQFKGSTLYAHKLTGSYKRDDFHNNPTDYISLFTEYTKHADILMNGVYWDSNIPQLFTMQDMQHPDFSIETIADITDDAFGSIPCNIGDGSFENPVYGVDKMTGAKTEPYLSTSVDVMAVGNLPNELPRDASRYFGEQLIKYVLNDLRNGGSELIENATILKNGSLTDNYKHLSDYALKE